MSKPRLFVLGAGCSYAAGLPDAARVMHRVMHYCTGPINLIKGRTPTEITGRLTGTLVDVMKEAGFKKGDRYPLEKAILGFYSRMQNAPERFWPQFNLFLTVVREMFYERSVAYHSVYVRFAQALRPDDIVINFNWDLCLEMALYTLRKPFGRLIYHAPPFGPMIAKPHGSIDFFITDHEEGNPIMRQEYVQPIVFNMPKVTTNPNEPNHNLIRLKSFDLTTIPPLEWNGINIDTDLGNPVPYEFNPLEPDVTPLILSRMLPNPFPWMLLPDMASHFYEWSYQRLDIALLQFLPKVTGTYIAGYSFPDYDYAVRELLKTFVNDNKAPIHVVNPGIDKEMEEKIDSFLGKCTYHKCGFQEMQWN
jgi:hypothetical protein